MDLVYLQCLHELLIYIKQLFRYNMKAETYPLCSYILVLYKKKGAFKRKGMPSFSINEQLNQRKLQFCIAFDETNMPITIQKAQ